MDRNDRTREVNDDSPVASIIGIGLPALVIAAAAAAYFLIPSTDEQFSQVQTEPPATTQEAPKANSDATKVSPESERKAPPAAEPVPQKDRDPRVDSQNAN